MPKDYKKQIEKAAKDQFWDDDDESISCYSSSDCKNYFIKGALSPEAKEYWQQGMYTKAELNSDIETGINKGLTSISRTNTFLFRVKHGDNLNKIK